MSFITRGSTVRIMISAAVFLLLFAGCAVLSSCSGQQENAANEFSSRFSVTEESPADRPSESFQTTEQPVSEHTHHFSEPAVIKAATCTAPGQTVRICSCGKRLTEEISPTGHTEVIDEAYDATCTKEGRSAGSHCSVCKEVLRPQTVIPATGHLPSPLPALEATCTQAGKTAGSRCIVCKAVITAQTVVPALGHIYSEPVLLSLPTCTAVGFTERECARCGRKEKAAVPALGHTPTADPALEASCTTLGRSKGAHCAECGEILRRCRELPALGHDFKNGKCTRCGKITGNASTSSFDLFKSYIWLAGRHEGSVYRSKRGTVTVEEKTYDYSWVYAPEKDAVSIVLSRSERGENESFSVTIVRAQTYLLWEYGKTGENGAAELSGILDFDRFDLETYPLPYCTANTSSEQELDDAKRASYLLGNALWSRAGSDAASVGISLAF